ncbi:MAG: hypothetical protein SOX66_08930, partial [Gemmiger qucibialis]|nr:hypothetical protein [Gemmiger qucibialis]
AKSADNTGCLIEHFGNADAVPQLPERCLSRKAGIVRCCLIFINICHHPVGRDALIPPRRNFEICYEHCNQFVGNDACIVLQTGCTQHSTHHTANNLSHRP